MNMDDVSERRLDWPTGRMRSYLLQYETAKSDNYDYYNYSVYL